MHPPRPATLLASCLALWLAACAPSVRAPTSTTGPVATPRSVLATPTVLVPSATSAPGSTTAAPSHQPSAVTADAPRRPAQVVRVVDGDTVDLRLDGRQERVRLIGVNTPETVDPRRPVECLGAVASAKAKERLPAGLAVEVESDPSQDARDVYDRMLLYVWLPGGVLLNHELVRLGLAHEYTFRLPYKYQAQFKAAQRDTEQAQRGLWALGACEGRAPVARSAPATAHGSAAPKPAAPATAGGRTPTVAPVEPAVAPKPGTGVAPATKDDCPATHPIKGNQGSRSTTDWIYHTRASASYATTDPEECFATEVDAQSRRLPRAAAVTDSDRVADLVRPPQAT